MTEPSATSDCVVQALQSMIDGFLTADGDFRVTFVNTAAQRLLGSTGQVLGRVLSDVPHLRAIGLETRCREVADTRLPVDLHTLWPDSGHWYHLRLLPLPDGLAIHFTDITGHPGQATEPPAGSTVDCPAAVRAARFGELTTALTEALTVQDVVNAVAERVLPSFEASGLLCRLIENDHLRMAGSAGYPENFLAFVETLPLSEITAVDQVLHSRTPVFVSSPKEYVDRYPEVRDYVGLSGMKAWAFLPLVASDQRIGYCVIAFDQPRLFTKEERTLLAALSGLIAQALGRARLYDAAHTRAHELQRALLPRELSSTPAVTAAARYVPAGRGMEVGGDWYDVIPLSGDRVALVIGDVMGHGLSEAVTMGRLRTAVRTLADLDLAPDELLTHLNDIVSSLGDDLFATCLYAVYDPTSGICTFARAGHPPPAVVAPDGTVHFPDSVPDPPLGAASPPFESGEVQLPEGTLLILYTDGLIESATRDIGRGMADLAAFLTSAASGSPSCIPRSTVTGGRRGTPEGGDTQCLQGLNRLCDALITALLPDRPLMPDDAALLIAGTHPLADDDIASWILPEDPTAARDARRRVRSTLAAWHLDDLSMATELLVSELVGNVIRHARGPIRLRLIHSRTLICEVSDSSLSMPRIRHAADTDEGGRGLQLVAAMSSRWGSRYTATGKCIWAEQALPAAS
ncbi:SpoIIE family protein phosphatase [Streptomyces sp. NBC_01483]|uniref:SpoIIE family protein phosphatase n=1 Tax=Streptomyces sp. NBC_01483 TaxID=2903883 RepID=UPI002E30E0AD|nr:SpoIIE family protein phosphatase [Streptomyces sp. NBC_01483]